MKNSFSHPFFVDYFGGVRQRIGATKKPIIYLVCYGVFSGLLAGCVSMPENLFQGADKNSRYSRTNSSVEASQPSPSQTPEAKTASYQFDDGQQRGRRAGQADTGTVSYQLPNGYVCSTSVDGWKPFTKSCTGNAAIMNGQGGASRNNLFVFGAFKDGLPHGRGTFCVRKEALVGVGEGCLEARLRCQGDFEAGKLVNRELTCQTRAQKRGVVDNKGVTIVLHSDDGFRIEETKGGPALGKNSEIISDVVDVTVNGTMSFLRNATGTGKFSGRIRSFVYPNLEGLRGTFEIAINDGTRTGWTNVINTSIKGDGMFDVVYTGDFYSSISIDPFKYISRDGFSYPKELLTKVWINNEIYEFVATKLQRDTDDGLPGFKAAYFKDPAGIEFDGGYKPCLGAVKQNPFSSGTFNGGYADVKFDTIRLTGRIPERSKFQFNLKPVCGTIKMPNGQSFSGIFDAKGQPSKPL